MRRDSQLLPLENSENRIAPVKIGSNQVGIGAIDRVTTVKGVNAERPYRLNLKEVS